MFGKKAKKLVHTVKYKLIDMYALFRRNVLEVEVSPLGDHERSDTICIFAHFSGDGLIHEYVVNYVRELKKAGFDVLFVSSSGKALASGELDKIKAFLIGSVVRENFGYDFGSWKTGIDSYPNLDKDYRRVIFCNDSVYGPFFDLGEVLSEIKNKADIWSMTDSFERGYHFQSYFWGVEVSDRTQRFFTEFWFKNFKYKSCRNDVIKNYELKLLDNAVKHYALKYCPLFSIHDVAEECSDRLSNAEDFEVRKINPVQDCAHALVTKMGFPFVKKELMTDNPKGNKKIGVMMEFLKDSGVAFKAMCDHQSLERVSVAKV